MRYGYFMMPMHSPGSDPSVTLQTDLSQVERLDEIPGIGPKRKQALMKHFGSVRAISSASLDELAALDGMTRDAAEKVKEYIGRVE